MFKAIRAVRYKIIWIADIIISVVYATSIEVESCVCITVIFCVI